MITKKELEQRRSDFESLVKTAELDGFLVGSTEGIYYLTGAAYVPEERPFFILFRPEKKPVLIVPKLEEAHMQKAGIGRVVSYDEFPAVQGWAEVLIETAANLNCIGVEPELSVQAMEMIKGISLTPSCLLSDMRMVKSPGEIEAIRETAAWADLGMKEILKASYKGATVAEIFSRSRAVQARVIRETRYDPVASSFLMASWPAPFSAQPHGIPKVEDRMGKGPLVALSYLRVNGYGAEVERTYFHHCPTSDEQDLFYHMTGARAMAASMVRPGVSCHDVDEAVFDYLKSNGLDQYILHRTGHGIGLGNHEGPYLARGSRDILEQNMVVSIEPGIYIPDVGGFRHSDTYVVTKEGCTALTFSKDKLEDLILTGLKPLARLRGVVIRKSLGLG